MRYPKNLLRQTSLFVSALVLISSAGATISYGQPRSINHPAVITEPGAYILQRSFNSISTGAAIVIRADNVSLDLNGETLNGPGSRQGTGISIEASTGVRVHNGNTANFGVGVQVLNSNNVRVEGMQISAQDSGGAPPDVEVGVLIVNSRGVLVEDNVISKVFLGVFVRGGGSGGNRIVANTVTGGRNGMLALCYNPSPTPGASDGPSGDLVYNNLFSRFTTGIATSAQSVRNIFRGNDIAFFGQAINEAVPGTNTFAGNTSVQISQ